MIIGVTEGGDPSFRSDWRNNANMTDGAIVISKRLTKELRNQILDYDRQTHGKTIVHCTCTGFGGTAMESNIPEPDNQRDALYELLWAGFPADRTVWRCDPIIPTENGLKYMIRSFSALHTLNKRLMADNKTPVRRVRISLLDNYGHVSARFKEMGWEPLYNGNMYADAMDMHNAKKTLFQAVSTTPVPLRIELCAETEFHGILNNPCDGGIIPARAQGCVSSLDLHLMGFDDDSIRRAVSEGENPQKRSGCHCLQCKTELLPSRGYCGGQCKYCYWYWRN